MADHYHYGYADERHDHDYYYAEKYHRHYDLEDLIEGLRADLNAAHERIAELGKQREQFVQLFIPMPPETMITDRVAANVEQARNAVRGILDGTTTDGISYTAYGLVQAAGEYLDHVRIARTWESRLNRTLMRPEPMKRRAMQLVEELVAVG